MRRCSARTAWCWSRPPPTCPIRRTPARSRSCMGRFAEGWHSRLLALTVFTDAEVFGWSSAVASRAARSTPRAFLAELRPGDFVVHEDHGIGRFEGLIKVATDGVEREYLLIQYAGTDRLYIPDRPARPHHALHRHGRRRRRR